MPLQRNAGVAEYVGTSQPVLNNQAQQLANAINSQAGTSNLSSGSVIDQRPIPSSLSVTIASNNGGGAAATTTNIFNNSFLTAAATTNGSGAASIVNTFGDGFSGVVYEQLFKFNGGRGILITGFTLIATLSSTGVQISTPFNTMNLTLNVQNGNGNSIPNNIKMAEAVRNTQFQNGILTPVVPFMLNPLCQLQMSVPVNTTFAFTFFTDMSTFQG